MAQVLIFTISHLNAQPMYHNFVKTNVVIKLSIKSLSCLFVSDNFLFMAFFQFKSCMCLLGEVLH